MTLFIPRVYASSLARQLCQLRPGKVVSQSQRHVMETRHRPIAKVRTIFTMILVTEHQAWAVT